MHPLFMAVGPAFKQGLRDARPFHIVDIYSLMCHILGLEPAPNNGSLSKTAHILSSPPVEININQLESLYEPSCYTGGMYVGCRREVCSILETRPMFLLLLWLLSFLGTSCLTGILLISSKFLNVPFYFAFIKVFNTFLFKLKTKWVHEAQLCGPSLSLEHNFPSFRWQPGRVCHILNFLTQQEKSTFVIQIYVRFVQHQSFPFYGPLEAMEADVAEKIMFIIQVEGMKCVFMIIQGKMKCMCLIK